MWQVGAKVSGVIIGLDRGAVEIRPPIEEIQQRNASVVSIITTRTYLLLKQQTDAADLVGKIESYCDQR